VEKISLSCNPCLSWQGKGGPEKYQNGEEYKAAEIIAVRSTRGVLEYLISWEGYDQTYNTWEPSAHIVDTRLIDDFHVNVDASIPLDVPLGQMREAVARALIGIKRPTAGVEVEVPLAALLPVARALLARAARPPSRRGKQALMLEYDTGTKWRSIQLQLDEPEDVGWLLQLQLQRDGARYHAVGHGITRWGAVLREVSSERVPTDLGGEVAVQP
jgi:hypothetical protein